MTENLCTKLARLEVRLVLISGLRLKITTGHGSEIDVAMYCLN